MQTSQTSPSKEQTIDFEMLATAFDSNTTTSLFIRLIQQFMAEYLLDTNLIIQLYSGFYHMNHLSTHLTEIEWIEKVFALMN